MHLPVVNRRGAVAKLDEVASRAHVATLRLDRGLAAKVKHRLFPNLVRRHFVYLDFSNWLGDGGGATELRQIVIVLTQQPVIVFASRASVDLVILIRDGLLLFGDSIAYLSRNDLASLLISLCGRNLSILRLVWRESFLRLPLFLNRVSVFYLLFEVDTIITLPLLFRIAAGLIS